MIEKPFRPTRKTRKQKQGEPKPGLKLDLGCGDNKKEGFIGVDIAKLPSVDKVVDLTKFPWPWKDGEVEEVHCSHFIEHLDGPQQMQFMNELHRILQPNGKATIVAPYYNSIRAWQDPTHKRPISEATFLYYNLTWRKANKLEHYPITANFDAMISFAIDNNWATKAEEARQFAFHHYTNVISDLIANLTRMP